MIILRTIIYLLGLFGGTYFTLFILTYVEASSPRFQKAAGRIHDAVRWVVWIILAIISYAFFSYFFLTQTNLTYVRASIITGLISGVIIYFKAGPNIDREEMEREAENEPKEKFTPKSILDFFRWPEPEKNKKAAGSSRSKGKSGSAKTSGSSTSGSSRSKSKAGSSPKSSGGSSESGKRPKPKRLN
jgi:uncharacterized membrane protein YgcG